MADGRKYFLISSLGHSQWEQPSDAPSHHSLPSGWAEQKVSSGRPYYVNAATGAISWERPLIAPVSAPPLPANWIEQTDASTGAPFYVDLTTGESTWHRPAATSSPPLPNPHIPQGAAAVDIVSPWIQQVDPASGQPFWVNTATGLSSWDPPPSSAPAPATLSANTFLPAAHSCDSLSTKLSTLSVSSLPLASQASGFKQQNSAAASALQLPDPEPTTLQSFAKLAPSLPTSHRGAVWRWESDDGSAYNDFHPDVSWSLENALLLGEPTFTIAERCWSFDLVSMTQTNYHTQSKRRIQRLQKHADATSSKLIASAALPILNANSHEFATAAHLDHSIQAVQGHSNVAPDSSTKTSAALPTSASSGAYQMHVAPLDFGSAIGKLVVAAKGIPIDIVHGVYVRKQHDVDAANELLSQINQLHDELDHHCTYAQIDAAMVACSDSFDAAGAMLLEQKAKAKQCEEEIVAVVHPVQPAPAPIAPLVEEHMCVICYENPSSHAFIPCGHKHICGACCANKPMIDALNGKCPTCSTQFSMILHIFEG